MSYPMPKIIYVCPHANLISVGMDTVLECPYKNTKSCPAGEQVIVSCPEDVKRDEAGSSICYQYTIPE